jgi:endonuclease YncB( thermonuclease family)
VPLLSQDAVNSFSMSPCQPLIACARRGSVRRENQFPAAPSIAAGSRQNFGTKAKHITSILVFAKTVDVEPVTTDRYGRAVAFVKVGDTVVNEELIRQGLARVFIRYCNRPVCQEWQLLEAEARQNKRGLWFMPNAIPPWEFRRSIVNSGRLTPFPQSGAP